MKIKICLIFFILTAVAVIACDDPFPQALQNLRTDYIYYKTYYLRSLDQSFWDVYNKLNSTLTQIASYYLRYNASWTSAYNKLDKSNVHKGTISHLKRIFNDINYVLTLAPTNVRTMMKSFYSGMLGFDTDPLIVAESLWDLVEAHMNSIPKLYNQNAACFKSFNNYHKIYTTGATMIITASSNAVSNITSIFSDLSQRVEKDSKVLSRMSNDLIGCGKASNVNDCVKNFTKNYEKTSEDLYGKISECSDMIDYIKEFYIDQLIGAKDGFDSVDDELSEWSDSAIECIENGGPMTTTTTKRTTTTKKTTTKKSASFKAL